MKNLAGLLIATGIISLLMPLFGLQLKIFSIFGNGATVAAIVAIAIGVLILMVSVSLDKRKTGENNNH